LYVNNWPTVTFGWTDFFYGFLSGAYVPMAYHY